MVRAIAAEQGTDTAQRGRPDWVDLPQPDTGAEGLVAVVVARDAGRSRVSVCGYLVDVYCLGVKDTIGPRVMNADQAAQFTRMFYDAYQAPPVAAPVDLAQNLVHGAVEYARTLGFDPAPDVRRQRANGLPPLWRTCRFDSETSSTRIGSGPRPLGTECGS